MITHHAFVFYTFSIQSFFICLLQCDYNLFIIFPIHLLCSIIILRFYYTDYMHTSTHITYSIVSIHIHFTFALIFCLNKIVS